jgi:endogenous inhibitor of DNA gyrase (YacG/DUF329 family)
MQRETTGPGPHYRRYVRKDCEQCGTEFNARVEAGRTTRFCCIRCSADAQKTSKLRGRKLICPVCGKTFYAQKSAIEKNRRFCSKACNGKGMPAPSKSAEARRKISESKMGSKNAAWRGEDTEGSIYQVFNVRLKGETCCRNCGAEATAVLPLHLHHAVPRSMCKAGRRDLRNGITLCHACHMGWHYRTRPIYRDLFTEAEWSFISSLELLGQNITAWLEDRYPERPPLTLFEGEAA